MRKEPELTLPPAAALLDRGRWVREHFGVQVQTTSSPVGLEIDDLVGLALRRNPRRAHLLVSTLLGKHLPVDPNLAVAAGRLLGELVAQSLGLVAGPRDWTAEAGSAVHGADPRPLLSGLDQVLASRPTSAVVVLGFAETATSLGHLVADQLHASCYLHSTRRRVPGVAIAGTFEEGHSHATRHLLLPVPGTLLDEPGPLILVDDELSTGRTAMGTISQAHQRFPRDHYILASLIDLRSSSDEAEMRILATRLGCRIDVVCLAKGSVQLPDGLLAAVTDSLADFDRAGNSPHQAAPVGQVRPVRIGWPADVPDGGRHGFTAVERPAFEDALVQASAALSGLVRNQLGAASPVSRILVVGTEEFMYLPLRLAQALSADPNLDVAFQSSTRSPVLPVDDVGYPIRRQFNFVDAEGDQDAPRFLYNAYARRRPTGGNLDPDLVLMVTDAAADTPALRGPHGPVAALLAAGLRVELVVLAFLDPARLAESRDYPAAELPPPLTGPSFGSYLPADVQWLLTDLSDLDLEGDVRVREAAIQAGTTHYAESLPVEFIPDARYRELFDQVLVGSAARLALAVGRLTELVLHERGHDVVFASLARAGTPVGILMRRWAEFRHRLSIPHYAISIVRGRGIDKVALRYLAAHHDPRQVVFVDGWTGKGAIAKELTTALAGVRRSYLLNFNDDLAVLSDPGYCVRTFGTREDFLIASACLNSTVSGLISRTVLNANYLGPKQFHGAKFYRGLAGDDVSNVLLDTVAAAFPTVASEVEWGLAELAQSDREPTFAGWAAIEAIRAEYGIESVNFVKPGVGETTRVLLRRVPWRILLREADNPDHAHIRLLAAQRGVPVDLRPDLPYACVGLIRRVSESDSGEG